MKFSKFINLILASALAIAPAIAKERLIVVNEGMWQSDNGSLSYFEDGTVVSNHWFRDKNGYKLGDTPNDIIAINDSLIAVSVNWSNIVQFMRPDGKAVKATENVANNRKLATDGKYVYVTSYAHECQVKETHMVFQRGFVAKIELGRYRVDEAVEVGYEPEGIAYYDGYLFVANTGGYAFQENHDYEQTVSVIDAETMEVERTIDTGQINLYGKVSQSGQYLCINSPGDYYEVSGATIILDCRAAIDGKPDSECFVKLPYAATYSTTDTDGTIYAIGSRYSYLTGEYNFNYLAIDPAKVMETGGRQGVAENMLKGTMLTDIKKFKQPYGLYVNPYTGYIYATDAAEFNSGGALYQWTPEGKLLGKNALYINPGHFLALPPDESGSVSGIETTDAVPVEYYNLQGISSAQPWHGLNIIRYSDGSTRKMTTR